MTHHQLGRWVEELVRPSANCYEPRPIKKSNGNVLVDRESMGNPRKAPGKCGDPSRIFVILKMGLSSSRQVGRVWLRPRSPANPAKGENNNGMSNPTILDCFGGKKCDENVHVAENHVIEL